MCEMERGRTLKPYKHKIKSKLFKKWHCSCYLVGRGKEAKLKSGVLRTFKLRPEREMANECECRKVNEALFLWFVC